MARAKSTETTRRETTAASTHEKAPNPVWYKPLMFGFMLLGLLWLLVYYISSGAFPLPELESNNIWIGIGIMLVGFVMTTRWR